MGLFFDEKDTIEEEQKNALNWFTIESFILEYTAITKFIITTKCGLPIISQACELDENFASRYVDYIENMEHDFDYDIKFITISANDTYTMILQKFGFFFILDYAKGSEEMIKRRLMNAFSTYESFFMSYSEYI